MPIALWILFAAVALAKDSCKGVEVLAISGYLHPLPEATVTFTNVFDQSSQATRTKSDGTGCLALSPGSYVVKLGASGFETLSVAFEFDELPAALVVSPRVGRIHDPIIITVRGQLKGFPRESVWIVMSHVLAQERYTTRLKPDGKFEFKGQFAGIYEVRAVRDGKILACATLEKTGGDQWVDLDSKTVCSGQPVKTNRKPNRSLR